MSAERRDALDVQPEPVRPAGRGLRLVVTYLLCLGAVTLATALVWSAFNRPPIGIDDAYIFFVYGRHLAEGQGFVYNVGGELVEGFTSFLWTVICGLAFRITSKPLELLLAINIGLVALTTSVVVLTVRELASAYRWRTWIAVAFGVALLTEWNYVTWSTITLMDTALWSTQLTLLSVLTCVGDPRTWRRSAVVALFVGLAVLTRPEALVWGPLFIAILAFRAAQQTTLRAALAVAILPLLVFVLAAGGLTAFRLAYFGYPLPNTYYAKMSPALGYSIVQGLKYFTGFVASGLLPFLVTVGVGIGLLHLVTQDRQLRMAGGALVLPAAAGLALPILTGGDHFGAFRFYQNVLPVLLLGFAFTTLSVLPQFLAVRASVAAPRMRVALVLTALAVAVLTVRAVNLRGLGPESQLLSEFTTVQEGLDSGAVVERLSGGLPARPSVGVTGAGAFKFVYAGTVVDVLGLNNLKIAHNAGRRIGLKNHAAFEKKSFYELQPDVLAPHAVDPASWDFSRRTLRDSFENKAMRGIFDDAEFDALYRYVLISRRDGGSEPALAAWVHRRWLEGLRAHPGLEVREFDYQLRPGLARHAS